MSKNSKIEWCDHTWNPWYGCHKVSTGCKNCYMYRDMARTSFNPNVVTRAKDATFRKPLTWKEPARVFTCSWSDFWIEEADEWRIEAMGMIIALDHLTFQILTKRPERISPWMKKHRLAKMPDNVWLGVSAENREVYENRMLYLLDIPAKVKFVSLEPLIEPIQLGRIVYAGAAVTESIGEPIRGDTPHWCEWCGGLVDQRRVQAHDCYDPQLGIDWVITGGESGPENKIRKANIEWFRSIRDQCQKYSIAFFHKQHGGSKKIDGVWGGRELDGRTWDEFPDKLKLTI